MTDLESRVRHLEEHQNDDHSGCGCLVFLGALAVVVLLLTGHGYVIDNAYRSAATLLATPTPGVIP